MTPRQKKAESSTPECNHPAGPVRAGGTGRRRTGHQAVRGGQVIRAPGGVLIRDQAGDILGRHPVKNSVILNLCESRRPRAPEAAAGQVAAEEEADTTEYFTQVSTEKPRLWIVPPEILTPPSALGDSFNWNRGAISSWHTICWYSRT